jgi:iron complex outermembrane recepter protein
MAVTEWVLCLAVAVSGVARAGEPDAPDAAEPQGEVVLEEIEVKSSRPPRVDTLEVREVRETAARDLGEALEQGMGLAKVRKAGIANDLVLRGMKKDDVNVLVDGARVHGACTARMDPPAFHLDYAEVDRVEVRRGPFDVTQPGGLGGLVDVRTRAAGAGIGTELHASFGSAGATETSAVASYGSARADLLLGGAFKSSHAYAAGDGRTFTAARNDGPPAARFRDTSSDRTAYDIRSGWAKLGLVPAEGQRLEVSYTRQSAIDVLYPYLLMDGISDDTDRVNATWRVAAPAGPFARVLGQLYWSRVTHGMDDRLRCSSAQDTTACTGALPRSYSMRTDARASVVGAKLEAALGGPDSVADARIGADFYSRNWHNETTKLARMMPGTPYMTEASIPDVTLVELGAYAEAKRALRPGLRLTAGGRADLVQSAPDVDRSSLYRTYHPGAELDLSRSDVLLAGNVQVDWDLALGASLFAGYGHGMRVPDQQERYIAGSAMMAGMPAWVGNPALRPTQSDELDLGARWVGGGLLVKAQVFHAWLRDYVTLANLTVTPEGGGTPLTAKTYANVRARTYGGEASARVAFPAHLFATAQLSYTRGENASAGTPLAEMPPLHASLALRYDVGVFFAEAEEAWAARQDRVDPALREAATAAWFTTQARVGVDWNGLKAFAGVRNLFDRMYYDHLSYQRDPFSDGFKVPEPGRTVYASLMYGF